MFGRGGQTVDYLSLTNKSFQRDKAQSSCGAGNRQTGDMPVCKNDTLVYATVLYYAIKRNDNQKCYGTELC